MMRRNTSMLSVGLLCLLLAATEVRSSDDDPGPTTIVLARCNTRKLDPNDPFIQLANDSFRGLLPYVTPEDPYYQFLFQSQDYFQGAGTLYGASCCDRDETPDECKDCLRACAEKLFYYCGPAIGATLQMKACYMRYENYALTGCN